MRRTTIGIMVTTLCCLHGPATADEDSGVVQLRRKLLAPESTGEPSEISVDGEQVQIDEAPPLGELKERKIPRVRRRSLHQAGKLNRKTLAAELADRFRDLEICRAKVARAQRVPLGAVPAGRISLQWTITPEGGTRDTLIFEETETNLPLMKCARRRMNAWRFTPPVGGPVELEYDYKFSALPAR